MWLSSLKRQHVGTEPSSAKKRVLERRTTPLMPSPPRRIPGSAFQAGTFLNQFAKFIVHAAVLALGRPVVTAPLLGSSGRVHAHAKKPKKVKIVSVCSGSEGLLTGLHELNACYKEEQIDLELGLVCSCEKDDWKRGWCKRVHEVIDEDMEHPSDACIFHNVETLAAEGADVCDAHKVQSDDKCKLPDWFDGLVAGFSCKDLSRANFRSIIKSCGGAPLDLMATRSSPGQTLNTLHAILKILARHRPDWAILENVDFDEKSQNQSLWDQLQVTLAELGYDTKKYVLNASQFVLPQSRTRAYLILVRQPARQAHVKSYDEFFASVTALVEKFSEPPPDLGTVLFPNDHEAVQHAYANCAANSRNDGAWKQESLSIHKEEWSKLKGGDAMYLRPQFEEEVKRSKWFALLTERAKNSLWKHECEMKQTYQKNPSHLAVARAGADIGQSISRLRHTTTIPFGHVVVAPTLLPHTLLWLGSVSGRAFYRPLIGVEALQLQGWPIMNTKFDALRKDDAPNHKLMDLAGNAFPVTVVTALINALMFSFTRHMELEQNIPTASTQNDVDSAKEMLKAVGCSL